MAGEAPQRTCLGCRASRDKGELLRFVLAPDRSVTPDPAARLPGRGAYTCMNARCLREAVGRRQFARAFKGEVRMAGADELVAMVARLLEQRIAGYLALANKAGKLVSGSDAVEAALRGGKRIGIVVLANDIAPDAGERFSFQAARAGAESCRLLDKAELGRLVGKELRSVVAVEAGGFSDSISRELVRYRNFFGGDTEAR